MFAEYGVNPDATSLLDNFDWYILPVMNPDGYSYAFEVVSYWGTLSDN